MCGNGSHRFAVVAVVEEHMVCDEEWARAKCLGLFLQGIFFFPFPPLYMDSTQTLNDRVHVAF